ncbi:MAG TPA: hypothetical protein VM867_05015, partial [Xanthobacteraceae bacterium]|nr:hypothetical protein [Xanthobacteraceae bacterium]
MAIDDTIQNAMPALRGGPTCRRVRETLLASTAVTLAIGAVLLAQPVQAADWIAATGNWFTPGNWNTSTVPTATDDATISNGGTAQVQGPSAEANDVYVGTGSTLQIGDGFDASINSLSGGGSVVIGNSGPFTFLGIGFN